MTPRIVSLLEIMNEYNVSHLILALDTLRTVEAAAKRKYDDGGGGDYVNGSPEIQRLLDVGLETCMRACNDLELGRARMRITGELFVYSRMGKLTFDRLLRQVPEFFDDVNYDLMFRTFAYVEHEKALKYGRFVEEWHPILEQFPDASSDCKEGVDCYALGLYTAGVFHAMRIAEVGLREIARRLDAKPMDNRAEIPIELADWQKVLDTIKVEISKVRKTPKGAERERHLTFYSEMADHCEYMKDYWRNPAAHCRKRYIEGECLGALERVRSFMLLLANNSEGSKV